LSWPQLLVSSRAGSSASLKSAIDLHHHVHSLQLRWFCLFVQFCYQPNAPLVLKGITLLIQDGEKVGVVGWTGSGKSTLIQALFRLIHGIEISKLGLLELRSCLSIIPQEPTLLNGTVQSNIHPLGQHTDCEIWEVWFPCPFTITLIYFGDANAFHITEVQFYWMTYYSVCWNNECPNKICRLLLSHGIIWRKTNYWNVN
jgi:hypothetical protein